MSELLKSQLNNANPSHRARELATAFVSSNPEGTTGFGSLVAWCPHCEALHYHGAAGRGAVPRIERRGAHCDLAISSPFAGRGYDLVVSGAIADPADVIPKAPMPRLRARLHERLSCNAETLRRQFLTAALGSWARGVGYSRASTVVRRGAYTLTLLEAGTHWQVEEEGRKHEGRGVLGLLSKLFGISPGIVARRILETINAVPFTPDAALEIEALIDRLTGTRELRR